MGAGSRKANTLERVTVLDGKIDAFIESALAQRVFGGSVEVEDVD